MNFTRMLTMLLFSLCFVILPITSEAATFTVNSTIDDVDANPGDGVCATAGGVCTLRAAIQEANALAGADTILLKAKKYYLTITGAGEDAAATGDLDITDDLKIKGVSSAETIINGGALDRVFHIVSSFTVKFVNLSIQNGFVQGNGGGIYNFYGAVSLVYCSVANNVSWANGLLAGGGIYSPGGSLNINSSSVTENMVISSTSWAFGGGIAVFNGGTLNITASKIAYNSASAASVAAGGGIVSFQSSGVTVTNSEVLANRTISFPSYSEGGGIALLDDSTAAVISETNISKNSSTSSSGTAYGGGLYFQGETAIVSTCTITGNRVNAPASNGLGGGIMANSTSNITINKASTIVSNLASFDGGGIKNIASMITVSPNSTVTNNMPNDQN